MKIDLDPKDTQRLEGLARREKKAPEELAKEIISEGLFKREWTTDFAEDAEAAILRQQEALERVCQRISKLPLAGRDGP